MIPLTVGQAVVITAFTGISTGHASEFHSYAERKLGRPIFTHEMAAKEFWAELKDASRSDFLELCGQK